MAHSEKAIDAMHQRVLDCLTAEFPDIPADTDGADAEAGFRAQVEIIQQQSADQSGFSGTAQHGTAQRTVARRAIIEYIERLGNSARSLSRSYPGIEKDFPMPYKFRSDDDRLTAMRAIVPKAIAKETVFGRRGIDKAFINSGDARIAAFETALGVTNQALSGRGAAVGDKDDAYEKADDFLDTLDDFIRNFYRNQPGKIAAWKIATHVERSPKSDKDAEEEGE